MTKSKEAPTFQRHSHWVRLNPAGQLEKEELFVTFETEWRGEVAFVSMSCDRSCASGEVSEWRIHAQDARKSEWGSYHTDTARKRLSDELRPLCERWIASDEYRESESSAYVDAIRRAIRDDKSSSGARDARRMIVGARDKFTDSQHDYLIKLCDAYDAFVTLYDSKGD